MEGKCWKFGDDVNTDEITPARYLNVIDEGELAAHCMEGADPEFARRAQAGDIIVAGKNFGCGSSREHAPIAIKAAGVSCVMARSFARIFFRNSFNMGLPLLESAEASEGIREGDELEVDSSSGIIRNKTKGEEYRAHPMPEFMQELVEAGGLIPYVLKLRSQ